MSWQVAELRRWLSKDRDGQDFVDDVVRGAVPTSEWESLARDFGVTVRTLSNFGVTVRTLSKAVDEAFRQEEVS